ncbi:MAG: amidophosphoribosyltransferase [Symbiobacteriia bacterium]
MRDQPVNRQGAAARRPTVKGAAAPAQPAPHKPKEECGVFGVLAHPDAPQLTYLGLFALQHRGQEAAGIAWDDGQAVQVEKGMGLVGDVFGRERLEAMRGTSAIGHVRYSTTGSSSLANASPLLMRSRRGSLAVAHNGNLINALQLRRDLEDQGSIFQTSLDTEVVAHLVARHQADVAPDGRRLNLRELAEAVARALREVRGGYAFVFLSEQGLIGARDPHGIRPLSLGWLPREAGPKGQGSWVLASESCAFDAIGASFVRDVAPGELVAIGSDETFRLEVAPPGPPSLCIFEYIYFARPDSNLQGISVHAARKSLGRALARSAPVAADLVTGVPDSSLSVAAGYAEAAGIPYEMGLVKNRYIGRTFIQPDQSQRQLGVRLKLNALRLVVAGKRVVLVDDSLVRGNTSRHIVKLLRDAGAREVHLRIASPPYRHACFYGIDTSAAGELIAARIDEEAIRRLVGADSLHFLSPAAMVSAIQGTARDAGPLAGADFAGEPALVEPHGFCLACFTGRYPVPREDDYQDKYSLERYEEERV